MNLKVNNGKSKLVQSHHSIHSQPSTPYHLISLVISIIIQGIILKYALENEQDNCECALTWHHKFIKIFAPIVILMSIIFFIFKENIKNNNLVLVKLIVGIYGLTSLAYIVSLIIYFFKLQKESNCECSKDWKRNVLTLPLVFGVIVFFIGFFVELNKVRNILNKTKK